jgi:hypothetical protein
MAVTLNASTTTGLVQSADTSGTVEIQSNGTTRLTVASGGVTTTGNTSIANLTATGTFGGGVITSGTAVASTSGTSIDFTSIPSWVKRVTVMFNGVSTNGSSIMQIQLGDSGGVETTSYSAMVSNVQTTSNTTRGATATSGFILQHAGGSSEVILGGAAVFSSFGSNSWVCYGALYVDTSGLNTLSGIKTLSATLDRVRITTVNGTDTFDAGSINIQYEG